MVGLVGSFNLARAAGWGGSCLIVVHGLMERTKPPRIADG